MSQNQSISQVTDKEAGKNEKSIYVQYRLDMKRPDPEGVFNFFMSMFSNTLSVMYMKCYRVRFMTNSSAPLPESTRMRILCFLDLIEHHYPVVDDKGRILWSVCDGLKNIFTRFPRITKDDACDALKKMDELCETLGVAYKCKFSDQ